MWFWNELSSLAEVSLYSLIFSRHYKLHYRVSYRRNWDHILWIQVFLQQRTPGWEKNFESFSETGDRQVTESAAVRSVNSGFRPTQDLQYLQCVVLKGGLFFRYSFAQMRLTFSWKQIKAGEQGSGTHLNAHWSRYNPFQKYRQQILSFESKYSRQKILSSHSSKMGITRSEILIVVMLNTRWFKYDRDWFVCK